MKNLILSAILFLFVMHADAAVSSNEIVFKADNLIDFKTASSTIVLSGLTSDFVPTSISFYGTSIVGTVGFPQTPVFSMGTSSGANDLIVRCPAFTAQQGNFFTLSVDAIQDMSSGK